MFGLFSRKKSDPFAAQASSSSEGPPLHQAIRKNDAKEFKKQLSQEAATKPDDLLRRNALHIAADANNQDFLKTLLKTLKNPKDINARDLQGWTPLLLACRSGGHKCAAELIKAGADVRAVTEKGEVIPKLRRALAN